MAFILMVTGVVHIIIIIIMDGPEVILAHGFD